MSLAALAAGVGLLSGHAQASFTLPAIDPPGKAASTQTQKTGQSSKQEPGASVESGAKGTIASQCADLLKMATALKNEVDKSTKDQLSVTVVRKAGEIEQLAHKVRVGTGKS